MKTKLVAAFLMLLMTTLANGFQSSAEWIKYTSSEGRYSALIPQQPKLSTQEATAANGQKFTQYLAESTDRDSFYWIGYFDYDTNTNFSLDKARDGAIGNVKGSLLKEEAISLGGYPGRDLKVAAKYQEIDLLLRARIYDIGGRVYILQHLFKKVSESPATAAKTARFFDSFKVTMAK